MVIIKYPSIKEIIDFNKLVLEEIKVKKADKPELLNYTALDKTIELCKKVKGDVYDKPVCLLKNLIQKHPFASGNRRTAYAITERFLLVNNHKINIGNIENQVKTLVGIREGYYTDEEIKNWIKKGKIRKFER